MLLDIFAFIVILVLLAVVIWLVTLLGPMPGNIVQKRKHRQGAVDYTRILNTQGALLQQQDALTSEQGKVVSGLVSVYKSLGGGWQMREGKGYIQQKIKTKMEKRTDWGEYLHTPESQPMQNLPVATE